MLKKGKSFVETHIAIMKPTKEDLRGFVEQEIERYLRKQTRVKQSKGSRASMIRLDVQTIDLWKNFISVTIINGKNSAIGYAKCNPGCDDYKIETGLSIATWRALRRLEG